MRTNIWRIRAIAGTIGSAFSDNIKLTGGVFCSLFFLSLVGYSIGAFWIGNGWGAQNPLGVAADISGVSFATAIGLLSLGGIAMVLSKMPRIPNILRSRLSEEERKHEREAGRQAGEDEFIRAATGIVSPEVLEQIIERREQEESLQKAT